MLILESFTSKLQTNFAKYTKFVVHNPFKVIVSTLTIFFALLYNIQNLEVDTSTEGFLHSNDPALNAYYQYKDQFGRDDLIVLAISPPEIFNFTYLQKIKDLHEAVEKEIPHVNKVTSLINARNTYGRGNDLLVDDFLQNWPKSRKDLELLEARALENPLYRNTLITDETLYTAIIIQLHNYSNQSAEDNATIDLDSDDIFGDENNEQLSGNNITSVRLSDTETSEVVDEITELVSRYEDTDFQISIAGSMVLANTIKKFMGRDMRFFTKMALLVIGGILLLLFRIISGVLLPIIVVIMSLLTTFSLMALNGVFIKVPTQIVPTLLLSVGVAGSIHLLTLFYRKLLETEDQVEAIQYALNHSGLAIAMTSVTTAAGLWSFSTSQVAPVADLGVYAGFGVLISMAYTIFLLPALLATLPLSKRKLKNTQFIAQYIDKGLVYIAKLATNNAKAIVVGASIIFVTAVAYISQVYFYHNPLLWLPEDASARHATILVDRVMKGSNSVEVIVDTQHENGLYDPEFLHKLDRLQDELGLINEKDIFVGKTISIVDILKEINKALNENKEQYYKIPEDRKTIAQELFLFENSGSDDLEDFVDSQFSKTRVTIRTPWVDAATNEEFAQRIGQRFRDEFGDQVIITVTGMTSLLGRTINAAIHSVKESYLIAIIVITLLMIILLGDFRLGLVSMIPNTLPIIFILGVMGYMAIPLDMFTMLIGSIAIGLAVDDTIHFLHNFKRCHQRTQDVYLATKETMLTTGRALIVTTIVLSSGFYIFMYASMHNVYNFGLLTGTTIIVALLGDLILLPAILTLYYSNKSDVVKQGIPPSVNENVAS